MRSLLTRKPKTEAERTALADVQSSRAKTKTLSAADTLLKWAKGLKVDAPVLARQGSIRREHYVGIAFPEADDNTRHLIAKRAARIASMRGLHLSTSDVGDSGILVIFETSPRISSKDNDAEAHTRLRSAPDVPTKDPAAIDEGTAPSFRFGPNPLDINFLTTAEDVETGDVLGEAIDTDLAQSLASNALMKAAIREKHQRGDTLSPTLQYALVLMGDKATVEPEVDLDVVRMLVSNPVMREAILELHSQGEDLSAEQEAALQQISASSGVVTGKAGEFFGNLFRKDPDRKALRLRRRIARLEKRLARVREKLRALEGEEGLGPVESTFSMPDGDFETDMAAGFGYGITMGAIAADHHPDALESDALFEAILSTASEGLYCGDIDATESYLAGIEEDLDGYLAEFKGYAQTPFIDDVQPSMLGAVKQNMAELRRRHKQQRQDLRADYCKNPNCKSCPLGFGPNARACRQAMKDLRAKQKEEMRKARLLNKVSKQEKRFDRITSRPKFADIRDDVSERFDEFRGGLAQDFGGDVADIYGSPGSPRLPTISWQSPGLTPGFNQFYGNAQTLFNQPQPLIMSPLGLPMAPGLTQPQRSVQIIPNTSRPGSNWAPLTESDKKFLGLGGYTFLGSLGGIMDPFLTLGSYGRGSNVPGSGCGCRVQTSGLSAENKAGLALLAGMSDEDMAFLDSLSDAELEEVMMGGVYFDDIDIEPNASYALNDPSGSWHLEEVPFGNQDVLTDMPPVPGFYGAHTDLYRQWGLSTAPTVAQGNRFANVQFPGFG